MNLTYTEVAESLLTENGGRNPAAFRRRIAANPTQMDCINRTSILMQHYEEGSRRAGFDLAEAISSNDLVKFSVGAIIDRQILAAYDSLPQQWRKFLVRVPLRDFKKKSLAEVVLGSQVFKDVPEFGPFPHLKGPELDEKFIQARKTGGLWGFSFEASVNDDLDQLMRIPRAFPQIASDTEDDRGLRLMIDLETGNLNTDFFTVGNANVGTLVLTAENLETVYGNLTTKRTSDGKLISAGRLQLVVGPALQTLAERILNAEKVPSPGNPGLYIENPLRGKFDLVVNEKQPGQSWIVMPRPGTVARAPFFFGQVTGYESPDFRYKNDQGRALGGGDLTVMAGSFDDDSVWYRGRHILGEAHGWAEITYGSDNSGM